MNRMQNFRIVLSNALPRVPWWAIVLLPALALGWVGGVVMLRGPQDRLVQYLRLLPMVLGPALFVWFNAAPDLRTKYPLSLMIGGPLCILISGLCLWLEFSPGLLVQLSMPLAITGVLAFYTFYFSIYWGRERVSRLQVGNCFPDFTLPDSQGRVTTLASLLTGGSTLMLFYKGDW